MGRNSMPPNPQGVPKSWGKKPKPPKPHSNSGRFDNGSNNLNSKGCAVTALALAGGALGAFSAIGYGIWNVIS